MAHCGYTDHYPKYLDKLRDVEFVLWEIGVESGASLRMWSEYLPCAKIYGFDIDHECLEVDAGRATVLIKDATKTGFDTVAPHPFVVIDDGSHKPADQMRTFLEVWPLLLGGGLYIIEDLHIWNEGSFVYHLAGLGTEVMQTSRRKVKDTSSILRYPELSVESVHMHKGLCILEKRRA